MNWIICTDVAAIPDRKLFLEASAAGDAGAKVRRFVVGTDFAERAIAPVEGIRFGAGFRRLGQRFGFVRGDKHRFEKNSK